MSKWTSKEAKMVKNNAKKRTGHRSHLLEKLVEGHARDDLDDAAGAVDAGLRVPTPGKRRVPSIDPNPGRPGKRRVPSIDPNGHWPTVSGAKKEGIWRIWIECCAFIPRRRYCHFSPGSYFIGAASFNIHTAICHESAPNHKQRGEIACEL